MLIDEKPWPGMFIGGHGALARHTFSQRYEAKRFVFTDETVIEIAHLLRDEPNLFVKNYQFALAKFPVMYVEFNAELWFKELGAPSTSELLGELGDKVFGYLYWHGCLTSISKTSYHATMHGVFATTLEMMPNNPPRQPPNCKEIKLAPATHAALVLGSTLSSCTCLTSEIIDDLAQRVKLYGEVWDPSPANARLLAEYVGDTRNFWALMLWLNQEPHIVCEVQPRHKTMTKKGPVIHHERTIVRLRPGVTYHRVASDLRKAARPRKKMGAHDVTWSFKNYNKDPNCEHDWPKMPDEKGRWKCSKCTQWRVFSKGYRRGDENRPVGSKEYKV